MTSCDSYRRQFCQTLSVNANPLDLFDQSLLLDMIHLGTPQLRGGVNIFFFYKVSFEKHPRLNAVVILLTAMFCGGGGGGGPEPAKLNQGSGWRNGHERRQGGGGGEQDHQDGS